MFSSFSLKDAESKHIFPCCWVFLHQFSTSPRAARALHSLIFCHVGSSSPPLPLIVKQVTSLGGGGPATHFLFWTPYDQLLPPKGWLTEPGQNQQKWGKNGPASPMFHPKFGCIMYRLISFWCVAGPGFDPQQGNPPGGGVQAAANQRPKFLGL